MGNLPSQCAAVRPERHTGLLVDLPSASGGFAAGCHSPADVADGSSGAADCANGLMLAAQPEMAASSGRGRGYFGRRIAGCR